MIIVGMMLVVMGVSRTLTSSNIIYVNNKNTSKISTSSYVNNNGPPRHPAFAVLHSHPGDGEACHYIVKDDILFYLRQQ